MIDIITGSKIRKKILALFIYNKDKDYYLSEVAQLADTSAGNAQRELNRLIKSDIVSIEKRGSRKLYVINKKNRILHELESIFKKTAGIEQALFIALKKVKGIELVFLFGSFVKGGVKHDSDVDLYVVGDVNEDALFKIIEDVEKTFDRVINYHLANKKEFIEKLKKDYFHKEIFDNCKIIYGDKNEFRKSVE